MGVLMTEHPQHLFLWKFDRESLANDWPGSEQYGYRIPRVPGLDSTPVGITAGSPTPTRSIIFCGYGDSRDCPDH